MSASLGDLLRSRRARLMPAEVGLRREEVAGLDPYPSFVKVRWWDILAR